MNPRRETDRTEPEFSIVIPTRDRASLLKITLTALLANDPPPDEILVVDQSRNGETEDLLTALGNPAVRRIPSDERGLSRSRNLGLKHCRHPFIGFLDDDCVPDSDWLHSAREAIRRFPDSQIWIGQDYPESSGSAPTHAGPVEEKLLTLSGKNDPWRLGPTGGNCFFKKSVFDLIGIFDPQLGQGSDFPGAEDGDMIYRALKAGIRVTYSSRIRCVHLGWRSDEENIQNAFNYGMGVGAILAKYRRMGDFYPLVSIFPKRFLKFFPLAIINRVLGRRRKASTHAEWCRGILRGFMKWRPTD